MSEFRHTVLQVLPQMETGGVERGTVEIAAALTRAGHRALVAASAGSMLRDLDKAGAEYFRLPLRRKRPLTVWRNIGRLQHLIEQERVDLVHARSRAPAWSALYAARRTGRPFVTTIHGAYGASSGVKRAYNSVMMRGDLVIAISEFLRDHALATYRGIDEAKIRVIPRGVDMAQYQPGDVTHARMIQLSQAWALPDGAPVVLLPGRLTRLKGQPVAIEALARSAHGDAVLVFVGGDAGRESFKAELLKLAEQAGVGDRIRFAGLCRDMPAAYSLSSVVLSASVKPEGFGRTAVEAQAMGRPVVVSDHGGVRETVVQGETGWRVPPGDAPALAAAIDEALALDAGARRGLAERAMAHVRDHFTLELMQQRTLAVYDELLEGGR
ncbi:MAG: glycosyltransferase family 4 protein [Minwuia sp.]|uniref:glycosyltransferase family 4 protein n=1 Tax=Minwuia sp. TaxID=2493630 RepID=UPI003A852B74